MQSYKRLEVAGRVLRTVGWAGLCITVIFGILTILATILKFGREAIDISISAMQGSIECSIICFAIAYFSFTIVRIGRDVEEIKEKLSK